MLSIEMASNSNLNQPFFDVLYQLDRSTTSRSTRNVFRAIILSLYVVSKQRWRSWATTGRTASGVRWESRTWSLFCRSRSTQHLIDIPPVSYYFLTEHYLP